MCPHYQHTNIIRTLGYSIVGSDFEIMLCINMGCWGFCEDITNIDADDNKGDISDDDNNDNHECISALRLDRNLGPRHQGYL